MCDVNKCKNAEEGNHDSSLQPPCSEELMHNKLLSQLHEQYAVNNNANLSTIISLLVALIAVIGCFGYVYVHTDCDFSGNLGILVKCNETFYLETLLLAYIASVGVLAILVCLCAYQGVAQRKEQFIIHAIREKYFGENYLKDLGIFPEGYSPCGKKGLEVVQGLYGELIKIFIIVFIALTFAMVLKFMYAPCCFCAKVYCACAKIITFIITIAIVYFCWRYCNAQIKSYHEREKKCKAEKCEKCCIMCVLNRIKEILEKRKLTKKQ